VLVSASSSLIGMQNAGIIVDGATLVSLNADWFKGAPGLAMIGLLITGVLLAYKVNGALLIGIIITTIIASLLESPSTPAVLLYLPPPTSSPLNSPTS
jgi:xanthine/uracil/vitamin C permease (AzgA family)